MGNVIASSTKACPFLLDLLGLKNKIRIIPDLRPLVLNVRYKDTEIKFV
jgi:hypothetical protein